MSSTQAPRARAAGHNLVQILNQALHQALEEDATAMVIGEDVGTLGGVFRVTDGLKERFGDDRVVDSPLAEAGLVGSAIGLALNGFRPVLEIQFDGFMFPALNQILAHLASMPSRLEEPGVLPITLRLPVGGRLRAGELHGESPETFLVHRPDLRVVAAGDLRTAGGLLLAAIRSDEPFVFLEPKRQYRRHRLNPAEAVAGVDPSRSRVVAEGEDVLIVGYGPSLELAIGAAEQLSEEHTGVRVLDLVSLAPLDVEAICEHARATGRVVAVTEAVGRCSVASEVLSLVARDCFDDLKAAPALVSAPDAPYPMSDHEDGYYPSVDAVVSACRDVMA